MTNIGIGVASVANVLSALEDIGFTVDTTNGTAYWGNDTNGKLYFSVYTSSSNTAIGIKNSSDALISSAYTVGSSTASKLTYEIIGDSIVWGISPNTSGNIIQFLVVAPESNDDHWMYVMRCVGTGATSTAQGCIIDGNTEVKLYTPSNSNTTSFVTADAIGIQIAKFYDGRKFCDNLYYAPICQWFGGSTTVTPYIGAVIGNTDYLVVNLSNAAGSGVKIAIKRA